MYSTVDGILLICVWLISSRRSFCSIAKSSSNVVSDFVSMDGGITFTSLSAGAATTGKAYGISHDARLFDRFAGYKPLACVRLSSR